MASTKTLRKVGAELDKVLGIVKGRADAKLPSLDSLKGGDLAAALLKEAGEIYTTDEISEETTKILTELGWEGPTEPPPTEEGEGEDGDGDGDAKSDLPNPNVEGMDHDDLLEELEFNNVAIPKKLRKETTKTLITLRALVEKHRPLAPKGKKSTKKEAPAKDKKTTKKKTPAEKKKEPAAKDKKTAEKKTPAEKKKEPAKPKETEKSKLGHRVGTFAASMDALLIKGVSIEKGVETLTKDWPDKKENTITSALKTHIKYLQNKRGFKINEKKGVYKIEEVE